VLFFAASEVSPMVRERVADNVYVFTSELYAQVNAGVVVGPEWSAVIDTLAYPEETREMKDFVENRLSSTVRYVILTHYHADHSLGTCLFPGAVVLGKRECRDLLDSRGRQALAQAQETNRDLRDLHVVLPDVLIDDGIVSLRVGKRTLELLPLPGHSPDGLGVLVEEDRVLFSGDVMMPLPYLIDGDIEAMAGSLRRIPRMKLENLVQGHGEVVLRGEIQNAVRANLNYLAALERHVRQASRRRDPASFLAEGDIEAFGKSRILLNGLAGELHTRNLNTLYRQSHAG